MSREKFEKQRNINLFLGYCTFDEENNEYKSERVPEYTLGFINGAWLAWQEQQKVVDELEARMAEADKLMDAAASDGTECVEIWVLYKVLNQGDEV